MTRQAAKIDANQPAIVAELAELHPDWSVYSLASIGGGCPDLLVGANGRNYLFEIKDPAKPPSKRRLTKCQRAWHKRWKGQVCKVETASAIVEVVMFYTAPETGSPMLVEVEP